MTDDRQDQSQQHCSLEVTLDNGNHQNQDGGDRNFGKVQASILSPGSD
jgi:hypothetical protein